MAHENTDALLASVLLFAIKFCVPADLDKSPSPTYSGVTHNATVSLLLTSPARQAMKQIGLRYSVSYGGSTPYAPERTPSCCRFILAMYWRLLWAFAHAPVGTC